MYFRKAKSHLGLLALVMALATTVQATGYKNGFNIGKDKAKSRLKINSLMQTALTIGQGASNNVMGNFSVPNARLKLSGQLLSKKLTYALQTNFGNGVFRLLDVYADYSFSSDWFSIRAGQFKIPFARQNLVSAGKLMFGDRHSQDPTLRLFPVRDIGVAFQNHIERSPQVEWAIGLFNGTGTTPALSGLKNSPELFKPLVTARIGYNCGDISGYDESDFQKGSLRAAVALASAYRLDIANNERAEWQSTVDFALKWKGLSTSGAAFMKFKQKPGTNFASSYSSMGAQAQLGYLVGKMVEPGVRYGYVRSTQGTNNHKLKGGVNLHFFDRHFTWRNMGTYALLGSSNNASSYGFESLLQISI